MKSVYSYLQYHWWPIALIVIRGEFISSVKYNKWIEGRAIKININVGDTVQIISIFCWLSKFWLIYLFNIIVDIKYKIDVVIKINTTMAWSWKNINCSIIGEQASCK